MSQAARGELPGRFGFIVPWFHSGLEEKQDLRIGPIGKGVQRTLEYPRLLVLVGITLIGRDLFQWKCPRCEKPFAGGRKTMDSVKTTLDWLFLPKKCVSCGLPKYGTDPSSDAVVPSNG